MKYVEIEKLENAIDQMRKVLFQTVRETGFNSNDTLYCSQELDELITKYQKLKLNNKTN